MKWKQDNSRKPSLRVVSVDFTPKSSVERRLARVFELLLGPSTEGSRTIDDAGCKNEREQLPD